MGAAISQPSQTGAPVQTDHNEQKMMLVDTNGPAACQAFLCAVT